MTPAWLVAGPGEGALTDAQRAATIADLGDDVADLRREATSAKLHPQNTAGCAQKADRLAALLHAVEVELPAALADVDTLMRYVRSVGASPQEALPGTLPAAVQAILDARRPA